MNERRVSEIRQLLKAVKVSHIYTQDNNIMVDAIKLEEMHGWSMNDFVTAINQVIEERC